ncbi:hypothetical protein DM01DRAFT_1333856 [Hesseltinella vesiculosa]|uniref:Uncharacterized protein n=1 Tax=Hesseltinella vesiculosa TaxID=101127 RepID=A0A1X2GNU4_9FUNG|nr:hypothetical protein DM01DRAFT_1333856 [Hesseltinella vesiculosa]
MSISKEQALCMFYALEHTDKNVSALTNKLASLEDLELCYLTDPEHPVLASKTRIFASPITYKRHLSKSEPLEYSEKDQLRT